MEDGADSPDTNESLARRQREEQAERVAIFESKEKVRKPGRKRRLVGVAAILVLLIALIAPTLAGLFGKGYAESRLAGALGAEVQIDRLRLSWFGSSRVKGLRVIDDSLREVADLDIEFQQSLLRSIFDLQNLGTVIVAGDVIIDRSDGPIADLLEGGPDATAGTSGPVVLPANLQIDLQTSNLNVRYRDRSGVDVALDSLVGSIQFEVGKAMHVSLGTQIKNNERQDGVSIQAAINGLTDRSGVVTLDNARVSGSVRLNGDRSILEVFVPDLADSSEYELTLAVEATAERGTVSLSHAADIFGAELSFLYHNTGDGYRVELSEVGSVRVDESVVGALVPAWQEFLGSAIMLDSGRSFAIDHLPGATVAIDELAITVPAGGALDLNTLTLRGTIETGEMSGMLDTDAWSIEPMLVELNTRGVHGGIDLAAVTTAQLAGQPAGVFVMNAEASDLFDVDGAIPSNTEAVLTNLFIGLRGGFEINDVHTELIESIAGHWLARSGVVLAADFGKRIDAEFSFEGGREHSVRLWVTSDNLQASGGFLFDGSVIRTDGAGVRIQSGSLASMLTRQAGIAGIDLTDGGGADFWVRDLSVDLDLLTALEAIDWRAITGLAELRLEAMSGVVLVDGVWLPLETSASAVTIDFSDIQTGAGCAASMSLLVDGKAAGELNISLHAENIIDTAGELVLGLPTVEGEIVLRGGMTKLVQPMVDVFGIVLTEDVGPTIDVRLHADIRADGVVELGCGVEAERVTGAAKFEIADGILHGVDTGVSLEIRRAGEFASKWLPERFDAVQGGGVSIESKEIVLALDEGGLDWSRSKVDASLAVLGVALTDPKGKQYEVERLDAEVVLGSGSDGTLSFNGVLMQAGDPVLIAGQFALVDVVAGRSLSLDTMRINGQADITGLPIAAASEAIDAGSQDVRTLIAELVGRVVDVSLNSDADTGEMKLAIEGDRVSGTMSASFVGGDLRVLNGGVRSEVGPEVIEQIRIRTAQARGDTQPIGARFIRPAEVSFAFGEFGLLKDWSFVPEGTPEIKLTAFMHAEGFELERGDELRESGAIGISPLVIAGNFPIGSIFENAFEDASLSVSADIVSGEIPVASVSGMLALQANPGQSGVQFRVELAMEDMDSGQFDELAHLDGLIAGAVGAQFNASVSGSGLVDGGVFMEFDAELDVESPRLRTHAPIRISIDGQAFRLHEAVRLDWKIDPDLATHWLLAQPVGAERVLTTEPIESVFEIEELVFTRGVGIFGRGVFAVDASLRIPELSVHIPDEEVLDELTEHRYRDLVLRVTGSSENIDLNLTAHPGGERTEPITLDIKLHRFADDAGVPSFGNMQVSMELVTADAPTALFDAMLRQKGLMSEVVGPAMTLHINVADATSEEGVVTLDLQGTRATGSFVCRMFEGRLIATEPGEIVVNEVRPELGAYVGRAVPVIGVVTKNADDGPVRITFNTLEVPLARSGDLDRLRGTFIETVVNLGTARFETSSMFSTVVRATGQRTEGELGRQIEPFELVLSNGIMTYDRTPIPLGEFTFESAGTYRFTDGYVDVVTYIPLAALTDEAAGVLNTGIGSAIGRLWGGFESATMVPWRSRGMPGDITTAPDIDLLIQNLGDQLNPFDLINQGLGSVQDLILDKDE